MSDISSGLKQTGILQLLLLNKQISKGTFLIIDNPDMNLHPSLQIRYAEILVKIAKELDVMLYINSNSPAFIEAVEVFSTQLGLKDEVNYYLAEKKKNSKFDFNLIPVKHIYKLYNSLSDPYDELDEISISSYKKTSHEKRRLIKIEIGIKILNQNH